MKEVSTFDDFIASTEDSKDVWFAVASGCACASAAGNHQRICPQRRGHRRDLHHFGVEHESHERLYRRVFNGTFGVLRHRRVHDRRADAASAYRLLDGHDRGGRVGGGIRAVARHSDAQAQRNFLCVRDGLFSGNSAAGDIELDSIDARTNGHSGDSGPNDFRLGVIVEPAFLLWNSGDGYFRDCRHLSGDSFQNRQSLHGNPRGRSCRVHDWNSDFPLSPAVAVAFDILLRHRRMFLRALHHLHQRGCLRS